MSLIKFLFSKTFLKQLGLALAVFLVLFFVFRQWMFSTTNHDEFREVPNLVGKKVEIAKKILEEQDLVLGDIEYKEYNPKFPKGGIVEHTPKKGAKVKEGRKVYISVNKTEYRKVELPNLANQTKRQAESILKAIGFKIGKITYKPHFAKDAVLYLEYKGNKIKEGEKLPYTSTVNLVLGDGKLSYGEKAKEESGVTQEGNTNDGSN